jgi:hypothetical protein
MIMRIEKTGAYAELISIDPETTQCYKSVGCATRSVTLRAGLLHVRNGYAWAKEDICPPYSLHPDSLMS